MPKHFLDGQEVHAGPIKLRGAVVTQYMRRQAPLPLRKVPLHRFTQRRTQRFARDAPVGAVDVTTFRREQWCSGPIPAITEMSPDVFDEPAQRSIAAIYERNEPLLRAASA